MLCARVLTLRRVHAQGDTRLALYGLGYMRDSRLYRMMTTAGDVTWRRPSNAPGVPSDSWFNLFFIHQNHAQRGTKNAVSEKQLPEWLDLVVWGHEHASKTEPTPSTEGPFDVSQPGSSVHTTLSEDEARPKRILLLALKGADWRTETLPLRRVRPFVFENVVLRNEDALKDRPDDADAVARFLHGAVEAAIVRAAQQAADVDAGAAGAAATGATAPLPAQTTASAAPGAAASAATLPLVRIRVDHSGGFPTVPLQRFGAAFQGRVANPWDLLQFHKAAAKRAAKPERGGGAAADGGAGMDADEGGAGGEVSEHRRIDALVSQHLPATLQILAEGDMALALEDFVQRDEKHALEKAVLGALAESQKKVKARCQSTTGEDPAAMLAHINVVVQELKAGKTSRGTAAAAAAADGAGPSGAGHDVDMASPDGDAACAAPAAKGRAKAAPAKPRAKAGAAAPAKGKGKQTTVTGLFSARASAGGAGGGAGGGDDEDDDTPVAARRVPARRAAASKKAYADGSEGEEGADDDGDDDFGAACGGARRHGKRGGGDSEEEEDDDMKEEEEEEEEEEERPAKRKPAAAAAAAKGKGKAAAAAPTAKRSRAVAEEAIVLEDRCAGRHHRPPPVLPVFAVRGGAWLALMCARVPSRSAAAMMMRLLARRQRAARRVRRWRPRRHPRRSASRRAPRRALAAAGAAHASEHTFALSALAKPDARRR
jgi:double-strand break repair protein MRE11